MKNLNGDNIPHIETPKLDSLLTETGLAFSEIFMSLYLNKEGNLVLIESHFNLTNHTHTQTLHTELW